MNFMIEALKEAKIAYSDNEVPVGAVIVYKNKIIASAHNECEHLCDNTAHAEMLAIKKAQEYLEQKILDECDIVSTFVHFLCILCCIEIQHTSVHWHIRLSIS